MLVLSVIMKFPPLLHVDPVFCGRNSWRFIYLSYLNYILSLESLQISAVGPGPVRWDLKAGLASYER